jgi:transcriptional regulator NrdR family protein
LWCPKCANSKTTVSGTVIKKSNEILRFRICPVCEFSFLTIEFIKRNENLQKYKKALDLS